MAVIALTFFILWIFSLWLLMAERRRLGGLFLLEPLALTSGALLFFVLSLVSLLFFSLLFTN